MLKYLDWHCIGAFALYCIFTRKACCKVLPSPAGREGGEILRVEWMQSGSSHPPSNDAGWHREAEDNILECVHRPWFHPYLCLSVNNSVFGHHKLGESTLSNPDKTRWALYQYWPRFVEKSDAYYRSAVILNVKLRGKERPYIFSKDMKNRW